MGLFIWLLHCKQKTGGGPKLLFKYSATLKHEEGLGSSAESHALAGCSSHQHHACALTGAKKSSSKSRAESPGP